METLIKTITKFINLSPAEEQLIPTLFKEISLDPCEHLLEEGDVQRIPQYYIASYVGIKPQSLYRIRTRIAKNIN
ncbi:hypothetical protein GCM10023231_32040 [Olivibacter ginsenosidimutans]|uniref:Mor transcription activator domain-containing protein n=1 Tax=Olivibacter ginsenosidimutans TaxID=1176537 RepID=A0ABP9BZM5_9SPHI